jgi:hypothetical protein
MPNIDKRQLNRWFMITTRIPTFSLKIQLLPDGPVFLNKMTNSYA